MMKIAISKVKNSRGRIIGYRATFAELETCESYDTPQLAAEAIERLVAARCNSRDATLFTESLEFNGVFYTAIVWHSLYSWEYKIITVDTRDHAIKKYGKDNMHACSVQLNTSTGMAEAIGKCFYHIAQSMYGTTVNGPLAIERAQAFLERYAESWSEFLSWANWQERYRIIAAKGYTQSQCHLLASQARNMAEAHAIPEFALESEVK